MATTEQQVVVKAGQRIDYWWRTENKVVARMGVREWSLVAAADMTVAQLLEAVHAPHDGAPHGCPRGSSRTGLTEIQLDAGIVAAWTENVHGQPQKVTEANAVFKSWEQLEAEELAGE